MEERNDFEMSAFFGISKELGAPVKEDGNQSDDFRWVSVDERFPEEKDIVLLYDEENIFLGFLDGEKFFLLDGQEMVPHIFYWLPIPPLPPKKNKRGGSIYENVPTLSERSHRWLGKR